METLNERIRNLRKQKCWTQLQLAEKLNITDKAVSKWEVGEANPDIGLIIQLASLFEVTIDYLLTGKIDEKISIDDMDSNKRMHYLIKKDDAENFAKYKYNSARNSDSIFSSASYSFNGVSTRFNSLKDGVWREIFENNAIKIFNISCDEFIKGNESNLCLACFVNDFLDDFVKFAVRCDRVDVLESIGLKYFNINYSKNNPSRNKHIEYSSFLLPLIIKNFEIFFTEVKIPNISQETLRYIFEHKEDSPKAYAYIIDASLKDKFPNKFYNSDREGYICRSQFKDLMKLAANYSDVSLLKSYLEIFKNEVISFEQSRDKEYIINGTYIGDKNIVYARFIDIPKCVIEKMVLIGEMELAKEMVLHNRLLLNTIRNLKTSNTNKTDSIYVVSENELERYASLNRKDISSDEKFKLEAVKEHIIIPSVLETSRNLKLIREILDKNYYNYYEFVYDSIVKKDVKELFKFLVDNELTSLAEKLIMGESKYPDVLSSAWSIFATSSEYTGYEGFKRIIDAQNKTAYDLDSNNGNHRDSDTYRQQFYREHGNIKNYINRIDNNPIINTIKSLKEEIYNEIKAKIEEEKKAEEERIEKEKISKSLSKKYFEDLLSSDNYELFYIKLCSLLDAIFKFDYHYEGEDFSERMNLHFKSLREVAPQLRNYDDGRYMASDKKYEKSTINIENERINHLYDIFNRLRIQRNNIAHFEHQKVQELAISELRECLEYVFSINKEAINLE